MYSCLALYKLNQNSHLTGQRATNSLSDSVYFG